MIVVLAAIALAACGSDDLDQSTSATAGNAEPPDQAGGEQVINDDASAEAPAAVPPTSSPRPSGGDVLDDPAPDRLLIVEVTVGVEVADVGSTVSDIIAIGHRYGGQVYGSDVRLTDHQSSRGTIVVKLPPANVEAMIADVSALGRQVSRLQNTDDVTDRVTDLKTRIATAQESVERVQRLLADAKDLGEVVLLESQLTTRQTALEQMLAEQRNLGNSTALATLTFELATAPAEVVSATQDEPHDEGIGHAFAEGGRAFVTAAGAVLIFIGYTAPFLAIALLVGAIPWMIVRRRARRVAAAPRASWPEPDVAPTPDSESADATHH
jgi:hypothetical protein